jgi:septum formation protein
MTAATVVRPTGTAETVAPTPVVLASASAARSALLRAAGVPIVVDVAAIDEIEVKASLRTAQASAATIAETLAELKAQRVSRRHAGELVIGADQILEFDGAVLDKPADLSEARRQLLAIRGRRHELLSAVVLVRDGQRLWHYVGRAHLQMRDFSEPFLDDYLRSVGNAALSSVGGYQIEGLGAQLFASIDGDYFTVLGLPLLPLLDILREHGVLRS